MHHDCLSVQWGIPGWLPKESSLWSVFFVFFIKMSSFYFRQKICFIWLVIIPKPVWVRKCMYLVGSLVSQWQSNQAIHWDMLTILLTLFLFFLLLRFLQSTWKYCHLPSPGICLPLVGHLHLTIAGKRDPVNFFRNLYRLFNKGSGFLWVRKFNIDMLYVGDISIIKELFSHRLISYINCFLKIYIWKGEKERGKF